MTNSSAPLQQLIAWLDDAHAMESGLIPILQNHASHFDGAMPEIAAGLRDHIVTTQRHVQRVEECLRLVDARASGIKSTLSSVIASVEGASTAVFRDALTKDILADSASEQFEVACYTALVGAATELGLADVAERCRLNLEEDRAMAAWLLKHVAAVAVRDAFDRRPA